MENNNNDLLYTIFQNVNAWLHFVEAKNAALIAFNIAVLSALMGSNLFDINRILYSTIAVGLLISTICALFSFKPINTWLDKKENPNIKSNLLHYAYIATLNQDEYLKKIYENYLNVASKNLNTISQIEKDYSEEIIQNSRIALRKQNIFRKAFYIDIMVLCVMIALIICA